MQSRSKHCAFLGAVALAAAALLGGCGGGSSSSLNNPMGTVTSTISDPPVCSSASGGPYQHVYVTIRSVQVHQSATAGANDAGWQEIAPGLAGSPKQIDLINNPSNQCFLAQLGAQLIPAGSYQQIRLILLANNQGSQVTNNACASANAANCVVLDPSGNVEALQLSSEATTGIKIPSGQIAGGHFTVPDGGTVDLNIDFDACASIVVSGTGQYRLKPVLHAGEVSVQTSVVGGRVVDSITGLPITGTAIVALEQTDSSGIDRVIMQTVADAQGNFSFCPVPAGTYDVVAVAVSSTGLAYAATITTGVQPGNGLGDIKLVAQTGTNTTQGSIAGQVSTAGGSGGVAADITLSALQGATGTSTLFTIPLAQQSAATASLTTAADASCPAGTFCASYTVSVPAANPSIGAFSASGTTYTQDTASPVNYTMDGQAFVPSSGATPTCSPSVKQVSTSGGSNPITVTAGGSVAADAIQFTGCS